MSKKRVNTTSIWLPPGFDLKKSYALQSVMRGTADEQAQKDAMRYIVEDLCGMSSHPEDLDSQSTTYYNLGRQIVGRGLLQISKLNLSKLEKKERPNHE